MERLALTSKPLKNLSHVQKRRDIQIPSPLAGWGLYHRWREPSTIAEIITSHADKATDGLSKQCRMSSASTVSRSSNNSTSRAIDSCCEVTTSRALRSCALII